jgi:hypothetical protein
MDRQPAACYLGRADLNPSERLGSLQPGLDTQGVQCGHLVLIVDLSSGSMNNDTPTGPPFILNAIDFEGDRCLSHGGVQFCTYGRAKHDSPVVKAIVNREDLGFAGVNEANPTHLLAPEKSKAFGMTEDFHTGVVCRPIGHGELLEKRAINIGTLTNLPMG